MYIATVVAISQLKMYTPKLIVPQSLAATLLLSDCVQMTTARPPPLSVESDGISPQHNAFKAKPLSMLGIAFLIVPFYKFLNFSTLIFLFSFSLFFRQGSCTLS